MGWAFFRVNNNFWIKILTKHDNISNISYKWKQIFLNGEIYEIIVNGYIRNVLALYIVSYVLKSKGSFIASK